YIRKAALAHGFKGVVWGGDKGIAEKVGVVDGVDQTVVLHSCVGLVGVAFPFYLLADGALKASSSWVDHSSPRAAIWSRRTVDSTEAACSPPMTEMRALGHIHRNRGEQARPHIEQLPAPKAPPITPVNLGTRAEAAAVTLLAP